MSSHNPGLLLLSEEFSGSWIVDDSKVGTEASDDGQKAFSED